MATIIQALHSFHTQMACFCFHQLNKHNVVLTQSLFNFPCSRRMMCLPFRIESKENMLRMLHRLVHETVHDFICIVAPLNVKITRAIFSLRFPFFPLKFVYRSKSALDIANTCFVEHFSMRAINSKTNTNAFQCDNIKFNDRI